MALQVSIGDLVAVSNGLGWTGHFTVGTNRHRELKLFAEVGTTLAVVAIPRNAAKLNRDFLANLPKQE